MPARWHLTCEPDLGRIISKRSACHSEVDIHRAARRPTPDERHNPLYCSDLPAPVSSIPETPTKLPSNRIWTILVRPAICYNGSMGTPTPPPSVPGNDCVRCDNVLWTPGNTPKFVPVTFSELIKCPECPVEPPNGKWWFEQHSGIACYWLYIDSLYYMDLKLDDADCYLFATSPESPPAWVFFYALEPPCATIFNNTRDECVRDTGSINGKGVVGWPGT